MGKGQDAYPPCVKIETVKEEELPNVSKKLESPSHLHMG